MTSRMVATVAAITSLIFGVTGLAVPSVFATILGVQLDATAIVLVRLACSAYLGYAVLAWLARDVTDPVGWRAVASANAVSWGVSAVVAAVALTSGIGEARAWGLVAMQVAFAIAWSWTLVRAPLAIGRAV